MRQRFIRIVAPIVWFIIALIGLSEFMTYMFIYHQDVLGVTYPIILVMWVVLIFVGRAYLGKLINKVYS